MKVLVTGASGLLGSDICHSASLRNFEIVKVASSPNPGFLQADLASPEGIDRIASADWDAIVHAAAWRSPEACDKDPEGAYALNARATGLLAGIAAKRNAKFLYISTDYVFPGDGGAPYAEDAPTRPINTYGKTKLAGEHEAFAVNASAAVLRIPFLYGWRAGLKRCALLTSALDAINTPGHKGVDASIVRYPTCTADVAEAAMLILEKSSTGVHHFTGQDKSSRYDIAVTVAELLGRDPGSIVRLDEPPSKDSNRPKDSHLSMNRLRELGCPFPPPFRSRMKECLQGLGLLS